jgi:predicted house-cleaning noncanonical NTP pyrophosphatase (MazG superfamily)
MANYKIVFTVHVPDTGEERGELAEYLENIGKLTKNIGFGLKTRIETIRTQDFPKRGKVMRVDA